MWEKLCKKCNQVFYAPTAFDSHICAAPPPANDELRARLDTALFNKHGGGSVSSRWTVNSILDGIMPIIESELAQVAARARAERLERYEGPCRALKLATYLCAVSPPKWNYEDVRKAATEILDGK